MPERRSPEEIKRSFEMAKKIMADKKKKEREKDVQWARGALMVLGVIQVLIGLYWYQKFHLQESLIIDGGIGAAFIGLSIYAKQKPVQALTYGLVAYVLMIALSVVIFNNSPFNGIILKIFVIMTLVAGINAAKKLAPKLESDELIDDIE